MTESPLFVYPHLLCTTCVASWLFVPWKRCGRGVMWQWYFTSCPSENMFFRQSTTRKKRIEKSRKRLLRRDSDSGKKFVGWRQQTFFVGDKSHLRWQVPLDKLVNLTSWLDKWLASCPLTPFQITWQVVSCQVDLSSQLAQSSYHASVGPWTLQWEMHQEHQEGILSDKKQRVWDIAQCPERWPAGSGNHSKRRGFPIRLLKCNVLPTAFQTVGPKSHQRSDTDHLGPCTAHNMQSVWTPALNRGTWARDWQWRVRSLSVCLFLWVCVVCVYVLLYLSFYLCCERCVVVFGLYS